MLRLLPRKGKKIPPICLRAESGIRAQQKEENWYFCVVSVNVLVSHANQAQALTLIRLSRFVVVFLVTSIATRDVDESGFINAHASC